MFNTGFSRGVASGGSGFQKMTPPNLDGSGASGVCVWVVVDWGASWKNPLAPRGGWVVRGVRQ